MTRPKTDSLARDLRSVVVDHLTTFADRHAPRFELPSVFAGFPVGADVRADLGFTIGLVHAAGVNEIAGSAVDDALAGVLFPIDGARTHTFFSYRVAETIGRFGPFANNSLLDRADSAQRVNLAEACDSTSWIALLDQGLPANYATVLTRCEIARQRLGLAVDESVLAELLARSSRLIGANDAGFIDDSEDGSGARYDIYSADVYLFTEPFADAIEPQWSRGVRNVSALVAAVAARDGSAMTWGRSLGALGLCHTIELAALVVARGLTDDPARWLALAANALDHFGSWSDGALVTAHARRSQNTYRGLDRWLQLTFDCLGKLAWAAGLFSTIDPAVANDVVDAFPARDELIRFESERPAAVWIHRSPSNAFVWPFVGPAWADYLPAPRNPGLYEVPVDAPLPTFVPVVTSDGERFVAGGLPVQLDHRAGMIEAVWQGFPPLTPASALPPLAGRRTIEVRVLRHTLRVRETLEFDEPPQAVSLQVTETRDRPLRFDVESEADHRVDIIDTDGVALYRSFWAELPRVHQVDLVPSSRVEFTWSVRPLLRVATADPSHHYHRSLYDALASDVVETTFGAHLIHRPDARARLAAVDAFHLHWPEWFVDTPEQADQFIELLDGTSTTLVWTQHNLRPHREVDRADELYQRFASAARVVVHHSEWGRRVVLDRYRFRDDAVHLVLPHGHFGSLIDSTVGARQRAEAELGLEHCALRVGIVGAPRREKQTAAFMEAFARTKRDDVQLLVLSLDREEVPDDPRISARPYEFVSRDVYNRRLEAIDVLALPFDPGGEMLTTGLVADVVGAGVPAIVSTWPYLTESLGAAGLVYEDQDHLVQLLETLDDEQLGPARRASRALRSELDWHHIAARFLAAVIDAGALET